MNFDITNAYSAYNIVHKCKKLNKLYFDIFAIAAREEETKAWTSVPLVHHTNSTSHYASVDTIHITDDVIVSGQYMLEVTMLNSTIPLIHFL